MARRPVERKRATLSVWLWSVIHCIALHAKWVGFLQSNFLVFLQRFLVPSELHRSSLQSGGKFLPLVTSHCCTKD